jgi:hypothetical protein
MKCPYCSSYVESAKIKVLLYSWGPEFEYNQIVLDDGTNTYWSDEILPNGVSYQDMLNVIHPDTCSIFTLIGEL